MRGNMKKAEKLFMSMCKIAFTTSKHDDANKVSKGLWHKKLFIL